MMREPEIHQVRGALGVDHDVFRLHVPMHDTVLVRVVKRFRKAPDDPD